MKVCLFTDTLGDLNGVSRFIQDMGEQSHLERQQTDLLAQETLPSAPPLDLHIVTSTAKAIPDKPYIHNLPYKGRLPMPFYQELDLVFSGRKVIRQTLEQLQPDKVHISTPGPFGWLAKMEAHAQGIPLVGTYHTDFPAYLYDLTRSHWVKRQTDQVMAKFYKPFQHVFSRSDAYLEIMQKDITVHEDKMSTLFPGTNLERFHPRHKNETVWQQFGLSPKRLKVLYVGRINIEKNIPFLLKVWQKLQTEHNLEADLVLTGEGRYRKQHKKMLPYHAHFLGPVTGQTLSEIYASSDLFVFPSITDTLGQVIMEAQASGIGCLVSNIGGPQTLIKNNQTGQVITADHEKKWTEALYQALTNADCRQEWGQNARPHMQPYDIHKSYQQFKRKHFE